MNKQQFIVIVQARMGSKRFPGKSMYSFDGKPSLGYLIDSLSQCFSRDQIWVATSGNPENGCIVDFCNTNQINVFSGAEENVASRFVSILEKASADYFIRINGDSPLMDYRIIRDALANVDGSYDLYTTVGVKKFPRGMNFEIAKRDVFLNAYKDFHTKEHFEHVLRYFYEKSHLFKIYAFPPVVPAPDDYRFSFDTAEDQWRIEAMFTYLGRPHYEYTLLEKCKIFNELFSRIKV